MDVRPLHGQEPPNKNKRNQVPSYISVQHDKPRIRSVHANKAIIRSGPSDQYYATLTLAKGAVVEVYLETSDGWSGIRPPAGSHNWIPSNVAYLLPGGKTAEIIETETPAWIGSDSHEVTEFMWQTSLTKTQQIQVLGEEMQMSDDGKKQLWYRIAPPQGEFRWVKSSQLSDSITVADPPSLATPMPNKKSNQVKTNDKIQLANHIEEASIAPATNEQNVDGKNADGKIVWSDEKEVLAQVDRQIQSEQAELDRKVGADGAPIKTSVLQDNRPASKTKPRPGASRPSMNQQKAFEHQTDSMRQWDAMQNSESPKMRVGPVSSILGLIGVSVVEADRAPVNATITRQFHTSPSQGNIGRVGPVGAGRLDRLPRPGQRGTGMTLPSEEVQMFRDGMSHNSIGGVPMTSIPSQTSPYQQPESTFSRWLKAREPLFGKTQETAGSMSGMSMDPNGPIPYANGNQMVYANPTVQSPMVTIPQSNSAWHGLSTSIRNSNPSLQNMIVNENEGNSDSNDHDEFRTPEIQSALARLTQEIGNPTEEWNLVPLRNQASQWIENGATALVRGEARLLMERIERFESLRQRTLGMVQDTSILAQRAIGNAANSYLSQPPSPNGVVMASAFGSNNTVAANSMGNPAGQTGDASGWLVQVHTSNPGQPEFALTDDAGNVIAYVQSNASLNLRRYLQQPVTIYGVRGLLPGLAAKQILAERVVRMR